MCSTFYPLLHASLAPLLCWHRCQRTPRGKDTLQLCLSGIDQMGHVSVKATTKVDNKPAGFSQLIAWVSRHRKLDLPISYVMESTGVYHEALAWQLHQLNALVSILLPNKAKHYLQSLAGAPGRLQIQER